MGNLINLNYHDSESNVGNSVDGLSLVEPGVYNLAFSHSQTLLMLGRVPKLVLWFHMMDAGYYEIFLPRYYNIKRIIGKPRKNGHFKVGAKSNLLREFCRIFPEFKPTRLDRIPLSKLNDVVVKARVRTVKKGFDQKDIPKVLQYTVIDELLRTVQV